MTNISRRPCVLFVLFLLLALPSLGLADSVFGHVVDPGGKVVIGATVYVFNINDTSAVKTAVTGSNGTFNIDVPERGGFGEFCTVVAKGFAISGDFLTAGENTIQLFAATRISGKVVDVNGAPIANVSVSATQAIGYSPTSQIDSLSYYSFDPIKSQVSATTDANGLYSIPNMPSDTSVEIQINDPKYVRATETVASGATPAVITAKVGATITGQILRSDGKPVGVVTVVGDPVASGFIPALIVQTSLNGEYSLSGLSPGSYVITARQPYDNSMSVDWASPEPITVTATLGAATVAPNVVLEPASTISGTVVDANTSQPVPGVVVNFQVPFGNGAQDRTATAVTDQQGNYMAHVWAGKISVYITQVPADYISDNSAVQTASVAEGQALSIDPISIKHGLSVAGTVVDNFGKPVPNLSLQPQNGQMGGECLNAPSQTTDQNGGFTYKQFVPGTYVIDAGAAWTVVSPKTFVMPATTPLAVVVQKNDLADVVGTVVDTSGVPVSGVSLVYSLIHNLPNDTGLGNEVTVTTNAHGGYTVLSAPIDPQLIQRVSITKDGYVLVSGGAINKVGDHLTIAPIVMADLNGVVSGTVLNGLTQPVVGAWVVCPSGSKQTHPVQTDAAGHFRIDHLIPGAGDLYAAKGRYFAHLPIQVTATPSNTTITLSQQPDISTASDFTRAIQHFNRLLGDSALATTQVPANYYRDECATLLSAISRDQALNFLGSFGEINSTDLGSVINPQEQVDATATARWAIPLLQRTYDDGSEGGVAAGLGIRVAPQDNLSANVLYNIAVKKISLNTINPWNLNDAESLTALAYATHRPEADDDYEKVLAALKSPDVVAANQNSNDPGSLLSGLTVNMATGNLPLALQLLPTVPENDRPDAYNQIITQLIGSNPNAALSVFHALQNDTDQNVAWETYQVVPIVIPTIFKTDPARAITLAKSVADPISRAEALSTVADLVPLVEAEPLYKDAEMNSVDQDGRGSTPASIAAHAYLRDPALGKELFAEAFRKVISDGSQQGPYQGPSYAEFAFYYSRIDPGYSRVLLENQFINDQKNPPQYEDPGQAEVADIAAMAALDPTRAFAMAETITDARTRFTAGLKVASYLLYNQSQRDTLPFSNWSQKYETWTPGVANPW